MMTMTHLDMNGIVIDESLATMTDDALTAWFEDAGLAVEVVDGCDTAACAVCAAPATVIPQAA